MIMLLCWDGTKGCVYAECVYEVIIPRLYDSNRLLLQLHVVIYAGHLRNRAFWELL